MVISEATAADAQAEDVLTYRFRPRLMGGDSVFRLERNAVAWEVGRRAGQIAYRNIARMRLGYRPTNLSASRFITELWARDGTKLEIVSISQRALFDYQNLAAEYRAFVTALARKLDAAGADCRCEAGFPPWRWWPALAVAVVTVAAAAYITFQALRGGDLRLTALVTAIAVIFVWQIGALILRNRPRRCALNELPRSVLP
jgi:hypothetical protein